LIVKYILGRKWKFRKIIKLVKNRLWRKNFFNTVRSLIHFTIFIWYYVVKHFPWFMKKKSSLNNWCPIKMFIVLHVWILFTWHRQHCINVVAMVLWCLLSEQWNLYNILKLCKTNITCNVTCFPRTWRHKKFHFIVLFSSCNVWNAT
jgi:hypothetical protein